MGRLKREDREKREAQFEAFIRLYHEHPEPRPGHGALAEAASIGSSGQVWALLNRSPTGRPSEEKLRALVTKGLGRRWRELQELAARLNRARAAFPLEIPETGVLPPSAGVVDPASMILQYVERHRASTRPVRTEDLLPPTALADFPLPLELLDKELYSPFRVVPSPATAGQALESWGGGESVDLGRPHAFHLRRSMVSREGRSSGLGDLHEVIGWRFRTSPDFALIGPRGESPNGGGESDVFDFDAAHEDWDNEARRVSVFYRVARATRSIDKAVEWLRSVLLETPPVFLVQESQVSSGNLRLLLETLDLEESSGGEPPRGAYACQPAGVVRMCLHHMRLGNLKDNRLLVGGATHYWAATSESPDTGSVNSDSAESTSPGVRILVTEEDLVGRPVDWSEKTSGWRRALPDLGLEDSAWASACARTRFHARWERDHGILAVDGAAGSARSRETLARYLRAAFDGTRTYWSDERNQDQFARFVINAYEAWGGAGAPIAIDQMKRFIDHGMHLECGELLEGSNLCPIS